MAGLATHARQQAYGQRWGEGVARCFSIEDDPMDDEAGLRLQPIPESFICPISCAVFEDPVATVDGSVYDRAYIERWIRTCRQAHQPITSPATGLELPAEQLMSLEALRKAIEVYISQRPELKWGQSAKRSFEEAASVLQSELLEKQAMNCSIQDEIENIKAKLEAADADRQSLEVLVADERELGRKEKRSFEEAASVLQSELLEKQAMNCSIQDEIENIKAKLEAADADRQSLEVLVVDAKLGEEKFQQQLIACEATVCDLRKCVLAEQAAHRNTSLELSLLRSELARDKAAQDAPGVFGCFFLAVAYSLPYWYVAFFVRCIGIFLVISGMRGAVAESFQYVANAMSFMMERCFGVFLEIPQDIHSTIQSCVSRLASKLSCNINFDWRNEESSGGLLSMIGPVVGFLKPFFTGLL